MPIQTTYSKAKMQFAKLWNEVINNKETKDTEAGYREMANDEFREAEASAWAEITIGDLADESSDMGKLISIRHHPRLLIQKMKGE